MLIPPLREQTSIDRIINNYLYMHAPPPLALTWLWNKCNCTIWTISSSLLDIPMEFYHTIFKYDYNMKTTHTIDLIKHNSFSLHNLHIYLFNKLFFSVFIINSIFWVRRPPWIESTNDNKFPEISKYFSHLSVPTSNARSTGIADTKWTIYSLS